MSEQQKPGIERAIEVVRSEFLEHDGYGDPLMPGLQAALRELENLKSETDS